MIKAMDVKQKRITINVVKLNYKCRTLIGHKYNQLNLKSVAA